MNASPVLLDGHVALATHTRYAVESFSASHSSSDTQRSCAGGPLLDGHPQGDTHTLTAVESFSGDHLPRAIHALLVTGPLLDGQQAPVSQQTLSVESSSLSQTRCDPHPGVAEGAYSDHAANTLAQPIRRSRRGPILSGYLFLLSGHLDGVEHLRKATGNRLDALTRSQADADGVTRGLGLDDRSPEVARTRALWHSLKAVEDKLVLDLNREFRNSPFAGFQKRNLGVGEKQLSRLLAAISDPYWNGLYDRPRTVSELWAYCGYSVIDGQAQRRRKGQVSNWSNDAKSRAFLIAESCKRQIGGHYRAVYDEARAKDADATHSHDCVRCGPAGKPALAGSPLSPGHQQARALRIVAKTLLRDLWIEARNFHEGTPA